MVSTNNITVFLRYNDPELRQMLHHLCIKLKYRGSIEDLIQDFYTHLLSARILQRYNRNFSKGKKYTTCKLSSYLYPMVRNYIIGIMKSPEYKFSLNKFVNYDLHTKEPVEFDTLIENDIAMDYQEAVIDYNEASDNNEGPRLELKFFYESFKDTERDKRISRRHCVKKDVPEASLSKLFILLYEGYSNKEISNIFSVSPMYVTYMKQQLANNMMRFGFSPMRGKKNDSRKVSKVLVEC